jgi:hypothetical protein
MCVTVFKYVRHMILAITTLLRDGSHILSVFLSYYIVLLFDAHAARLGNSNKTNPLNVLI